MRRFFIMAFAATAIAAPAAADEITDAIDGALAAYNDGDIAYATEELNYALQLLSEMKSETLAQFLPAAQDGWTREDDDGMAAGLGMVGGIVSAATNGSKAWLLPSETLPVCQVVPPSFE